MKKELVKKKKRKKKMMIKESSCMQIQTHVHKRFTEEIEEEEEDTMVDSTRAVEVVVAMVHGIGKSETIPR